LNEVGKNPNMDLSKLASSVLEEYGIEPENISVVQSANIKTVWRIKTKT